MTISFWVILIAVLAYGGLHSWLASLNIKGWALERFGQSAYRFYRLIYNIIALVTFIPLLMLLVALVDVEIYRIPLPWMVITLLLQLSAVVTLIAGVYQTGVLKFLGVCQFIQCEGETSPSLVVTGLYRYVRHPLYTAGLAFIWLMPWMSWNLLALNIGISIYILIGAMFEERKLILEYGEAYLEYRNRTPMLVPGIKTLKS